jgi:phosphatidate cytidylyltransferase
MLQRAITGAVFLIVLLGAIIIHPVLLFFLFLILTIIGTSEFYAIAKKAGAKVLIIPGILATTIVFALFTSYFLFKTPGVKYLSLTLILPFIAMIVELYRKTKNPVFNIATLLSSIIYIALPFAFVCSFAVAADFSINYNPNILLGYFFLVWTSDTGAYLAGRAFGKHKLFERISPKKTWEGFIGGLILSVIIAYVLSVYFTELKLIHWIVTSVIIVVTGAYGDLVESMFKRSTGVKDSGKLMPGHGGVLDRFDAVLFSAPFVWAYLTLIN